MSRSENYIIQLELEIQRLKSENNILDTALFDSCQTLCKGLNFKEGEDEKLKQTFINKARENYNKE